VTKARAQIVFSLLLLLVCGAIVGYAAIPNNTISHNQGAVLPTFNATGAGYYVGVNQIVSAARAAQFVTLDTGQGANELYDMDQDVLSTSDVIFNSVDAREYFLDTVNKTDIFAYPQTEASYIIWTDGTTYYAKNGTTGSIEFSGADKAIVIQAAYDSLTAGKILLKDIDEPAVLLRNNSDVQIVELNNFRRYGLTFEPLLVDRAATVLSQAYPLYNTGMFVSPHLRSIGYPIFHSGLGEIFVEREFGNLEYVATFNVAGKGIIQRIGINMYEHYLIISGAASPYTAYYYLSAADVTADIVNAQQAGVRAPHLTHGGIHNLYTNAGVRGFLWAEYDTDGVDHRIWRVTQAGAGAAVFTAVLTLTSVTTRHIHSLDWDIYNSGTIYATTGDADALCHWYKSTDWGATWAQVIAGGGQYVRTLRLFFTSDYIYYGVDGYVEDNASMFYRVERGNLTDRTTIYKFPPYFYCYGGTYSWTPRGILINFINRGAPYGEPYLDVPIYFYDLDNEKMYKVFTIENSDWPSQGIGDSMPYQSPTTGKIYMHLSHAPMEFFLFDNHVVGVKITGIS